MTQATGGVVSYAAGYKIHTFQGSGNLLVTEAGNIEVLAVGGGAGGNGEGFPFRGGGGGAGKVYYNVALAVGARNITIVIGTGGGPTTNGINTSISDGNISFSTIVADGGQRSVVSVNRGGDSGNGFTGGIEGASGSAGGGAGASENGHDGLALGFGGDGGNGLAYDISGTSQYYGGGGGGNGFGTGGLGGGGNSPSSILPGTNGSPNTGGGGGGGGFNGSAGGSGGSGIVIIRYTYSPFSAARRVAQNEDLADMLAPRIKGRITSTGIPQDLTAAEVTALLQPLLISDTAYDATTWDGVTTIAPSKNAVRDKIETMISGSGTTGQLVKWTGAGTIGDAAIIPPATNILTLTNAAASTLALNITAAKTLTLIAVDNYTITFPATLTVAGLAVGNVYTTTQTITPATDVVGLIINKSTTADFLQAKSGASVLFSVAASGKTTILALANVAALLTVGDSNQTGLVSRYTLSQSNTSIGSVNSTIQLNNANTTAGNYSVFSFAQNTAVDALIGVKHISSGVGAIVLCPASSLNNYSEVVYIKSLVMGIGTTNPLTRLHVSSDTADTSTIVNVLTIEQTSTGTAAAGLGAGLLFSLETATASTNKNAGRAWAKWIVPTNGSETSAVGLDAYTNSTAQEFISGQGDAGGVKLSFYAGTRVARGAALTTQLTTITFTAPGTPDYALQDVTNIAPYGFTDAEELRTFISVVKNLQDRCAQLEARLGSATGVNLFA